MLQEYLQYKFPRLETGLKLRSSDYVVSALITRDSGLEVTDVVYLLSHVWLFCNPMNCSPQSFSVHGISQARILGRVAISLSRASPNPRIKFAPSALAGKFFTTEPPGKPSDRDPVQSISGEKEFTGYPRDGNLDITWWLGLRNLTHPEHFPSLIPSPYLTASVVNWIHAQSRKYSYWWLLCLTFSTLITIETGIEVLPLYKCPG